MNIPTMPIEVKPPYSKSNRRRHTRRNYLLVFGAVLSLGAFLLITCAPSVSVPPRVRIVPSQEQKSATPAVADARRISAQADVHRDDASRRVGSAKSGLGESASEMQSLVMEVGRLKKQKAASENELLALYNRLVAQEKLSRVLLTEISAAEIALAEERTLRNKVGEKLVEAENLIYLRDAEASQLRGQLEHSQKEADQFSDVAQKSAQAEQASKAETATAKGAFKMLAWILAGMTVAFLISAFINVIQFRGRLPI